MAGWATGGRGMVAKGRARRGEEGACMGLGEGRWVSGGRAPGSELKQRAKERCHLVIFGTLTEKRRGRRDQKFVCDCLHTALGGYVKSGIIAAA